MENFWKTKEGKILSHGIHDHVTASSAIKRYCEFVVDRLDNLSKEEIKNRLNIITKLSKKCDDSIDYIYKKIKEIKGYE